MANSSAWTAMSGLNGQTAILLIPSEAHLAQSAGRKALNLLVVGSSPTVGAAALESNPGHSDGNDVFYHQTTDATGSFMLG